MLTKEFKAAAVVLGLAAPLLAHSQTIPSGTLIASTSSVSDPFGQSHTQLVHQDSQYGTWQASETVTDTFYYYFNGEAFPIDSTASVNIQADVTPGSVVINASGQSGGVTGFGTEDAQASATFFLNVTRPTVWTLALDDQTGGWGEYNLAVRNELTSDYVWQDFKTWSDRPQNQKTFSVALGPGEYALYFDFDAVNLTDTGGDAGNLTLSMTSPVPLPASAGLLASALALLGAMRWLGRSPGLTVG